MAFSGQGKIAMGTQSTEGSAWDRFDVLRKRPAGADFFYLPDASFYVFFALAAGPEWVVSCTDLVEYVPGWEEKGENHKYEAETRALVDEGLGDTLALVGQPPRPYNRDWYYRSSSLPLPTALTIATRIAKPSTEFEFDAQAAMQATWDLLNAHLRESLEGACREAAADADP